MQPIIGNLLVLRGINRLLLSPFHFSHLGVEKWNPIQTKNAVRLSKINMQLAMREEKKAPPVSWVAFLVSGEEEEEEEEEGEDPLFAKFLKKVPSREQLNLKIKQQEEVTGKPNQEQRNNIITASLTVFRDFLVRYLLLLWSHPALSSLMQKLTTTALSEIMFHGSAPSPHLRSSSSSDQLSRKTPSTSSSSSNTTTTYSNASFDDISSPRPPSTQESDPIRMLGVSDISLSMSTPMTLRSDRAKPPPTQ